MKKILIQKTQTAYQQGKITGSAATIMAQADLRGIDVMAGAEQIPKHVGYSGIGMMQAYGRTGNPMPQTSLTTKFDGGAGIQSKGRLGRPQASVGPMRGAPAGAPPNKGTGGGWGMTRNTARPSGYAPY